MIGSQSVIAIIPARSGSKRLEGKNLKPLLGKPLRLILTGKSNAPSISDLLYLIGKENCINRIDNYLNS